MSIVIPDVTGYIHPDSKVHGANMGPIWGQQDPGGPNVSPMNFAIRAAHFYQLENSLVSIKSSKSMTPDENNGQTRSKEGLN